MRRGPRRAGFAAVLLAATLAACGGQETAQEPAGPTVPSPEDLAAALVTPEDLGPGWSVTPVPDEAVDDSGVVSDEASALLPRVDLCDAAGASAQQAAEQLRWKAYRQVELATDTPTRPPSPGEPPRHHLVFVQEFLTSGATDEVATTYAELVAGSAACLGASETTRDGETVRTVPLTVPDLGDGSHGWRQLVTEPGPRAHRARWDLRQVLVRDGEVLMMATVAEITSPDVHPVLDAEQVASILTTMADKLP